MELTLKEAIEVAGQVKAGENLPILGQRFYPRTAVKYLSGLSDAIEQTELVLQKNASEVGVRNIDKNSLDNPFLVLGMRMNFDTTTASVNPKIAKYDDPAPVYWQNGELKITQGEVLSELPVSVISNDYASTSNKDDVFNVAPFLIRPNKSFNINALLAGTAGANHAFRLELIGIEFLKNERV